MLATAGSISRKAARPSFYETLRKLRLLDNLQVCLDAGDRLSFEGGADTWRDLSGNGNHFYLGSGTGADAADPTHNGVSGRRTKDEYFSSDGGDAFLQAGSWTFANSWHKDNATFTVAAWVWVPSGALNPPGFILMRNIFDANDPGISIQINPLSGSGCIAIGITDGVGGSFSLLPPTNDTIIEGGWMFAAVSLSEGSGTSFVRENGVVELLSSDTYTSPSSSNPTAAMVLWGFPDAAGTALYTTAPNGLAPSGSRMNSLMAWNRALSQAEVTALYSATKGKFGL